MSFPSASQYLTSDTLKFTNPDGSPMRVFAEAGEITDRPMLMRRLKKYGATISHEPREAQIILVDPSTISGRRFIRDWGQDSNKVVLSSIWVRKSIEAGYPLLANDQWGDCLAIDDGLPIGSGDEEEDNVPNSLPTPRTTPVDQQTASVSNLYHAQSQVVSEAAPPVQPNFQMHLDAMTQAAALQQAMGLPANAVPGAQAQPVVGLPGAMPFMPTPFGMGMNFPNALIPQAQQAMLFTLLNSPFGAAMAQNFNIALQDVLNRTPTEAHTTFHHPNTTIDHNASSLPNQAQVAESSTGRRHSSKRSRSIDNSTSPPPEPKVKSRQGKQREVEAITTMQPQLFVSPSGEPYTFYVQIEIPQRQDLVNNIKKNGGKLEQNHELADYVILHKRTAASKSSKTLLQSIHAAGKMALSSRFVRDCIDKRKLVNEAAYELENPHIRKRRRVTASVPQKKEEEEVGSEAERQHKREEQKLARSERRAERKQHEEKERLEDAPSTSYLDVEPSSERHTVSNKPKARIDSTAHASASRYPSPPTPPPPHTKIPLARGYKFSDAENEYALKCAKLLIDHDHTISTSAICSYIHQTLEHHTARSWVTHFANLQPDKVNKWRKASGIKFRKAQAMANQSADNESVGTQPLFESPRPMSEERDPSPLPVSNRTRAFTNADIDRHMDVVAKFFADGNDDDQEVPPSVLWERLALQVPERTGTGWEEFYNENHEVITKRYNALLDS